MSATHMANTTQLYVRSNIHMSNLDIALKRHLHLQKFVDVTLSCEGRKFKCHRLILAAASPLLERLLLDHPTPHPIVIMPFDVKAWTMQALIEFIYTGHVRVSQVGLHDLVRSAEILQITGLEHARKDFGMYCNGERLRKPTDTGRAFRRSYSSSISDNTVAAEETYDDDDGEDTDETTTNTQHVNDTPTYNTDGARQERAFTVRTQSRDVPGDVGDEHNAQLTEQQANANRPQAIGKIRVKSTETLLKPCDSKALSVAAENRSTLARLKVCTTAGETGICSNQQQQQQNGAHKNLSDAALELTHAQRTEATTAQPATAHIKIELSETPPFAVENIVCQPNMSYMYNGSNCSSPELHADDMPLDEPAAEATHSLADGYYLEAAERDTSPPLQLFPAYETASDTGAEVTITKMEVCEELFKLRSCADSNTQRTQQLLYDSNMPATLSLPQQKTTHAPKAASTASKSNRRKHTPAQNKTAPVAGAVSGNNNNNNNSSSNSAKDRILRPYDNSVVKLTELQPLAVGASTNVEPSVETVVLRSPRTNQPRNYSTQALYNALMAVKHGESIYRASREHHVPRKTLRNWMKRWNIKSQYPMPKQLKDAAIRKKNVVEISAHQF